MTIAFTGGAILTPVGFQTDMSLLVEGSVITAVGPTAHQDADTVIDLAGDMLIPGFTDIQVNGGGGILFNDNPTVDAIRAIGRAHRPFGTTGYLPTLISDDLDKTAAAIAAVDAAITEGVPGVLGIHIEGPFLNPLKKGIHNADKFRTLDDAAIDLLSSLKHGVTHVTLAPEQTSPDMIRKLVQRGVKVSAGHTNATYEETMDALDAGLSGFTHLYNAMTPMESRKPGVVGAAFAYARSFAGIIVDGFHVHPGSLKAAIAAKGIHHMMLVTDAMPCVGAKDKSFRLQGIDIKVIDGKCTGPDGTLAGSDLDMISAVRNSINWLDISLESAVAMASTSPAAYLGLTETIGTLETGKQANMLRLSASLDIKESWIGGREATDPTRST
ncbi:N-acetylglucosamine-6-phosphate deacetylase [Kordiimonas sediminis]|uniref:N-acetylglucosamine-6-phosphate deacetylase n=1 Tax=Kordiimonas sediminis TaxID=1735581 RepID=A0A919AMC5_9PROT|nr:N-acetylglucosamine-6-phosphate deacetylase [Kordiimonas sediminis]GHF13756.1 N-acetylglucosamine-6-phosphate deacetylase [Kordiimonas sediminis]